MTIQLTDLITPTSVTLVRQDVLPNLPPALNAKARIASFLRAVSLVKSTKRDKDKFRPDVTKSQSHNFTYKYTTNRVPRGEPLTDNRIRNPIVFNFTGIITETPFISITDPGGVLSGLPFIDRVNGYLQQLRVMADSGDRFYVYTSTFVHTGMVITRLTVSKGQDTGQAAEVRLSMQQIRTSTEVRVDPLPSDEASQLGLLPTVTGTG